MNVRPLKLVFCRNQGRAPQWSRWKLMEGGRVSTNICGTSVSSCCRQSCDHLEAVNSLADEQQVDLSWVDQVNVGQSVHPLQTRMDPTVQLTHTHKETQTFTHTEASRSQLEGSYSLSHHDLSSFELQDDAGPSHLLTGPPAHRHTLKPHSTPHPNIQLKLTLNQTPFKNQSIFICKRAKP